MFVKVMAICIAMLIAAIVVGCIIFKRKRDDEWAQKNLSARDYWRWKNGGID